MKHMLILLLAGAVVMPGLLTGCTSYRPGKNVSQTMKTGKLINEPGEADTETYYPGKHLKRALKTGQTTGNLTEIERAQKKRLSK